MNVRNRPERWSPQATSWVPVIIDGEHGHLVADAQPEGEKGLGELARPASSSPKVTVRPTM